MGCWRGLFLLFKIWRQTLGKHLHPPGEGNGTPLQYSCLENPMDRGAWWAAVHGGHWESGTTERLHFHFSLSCIGEGNSNPLQCSCLENPRDGRAWWADVYGVEQSRTRLTQLSSSSSSHILQGLSRVIQPDLLPLLILPTPSPLTSSPCL